MRLQVLAATILFLAAESVLAQQVSRVWQTKTSSKIVCLGISPDDTTPAVGYRDKFIELWDVASVSATKKSAEQNSITVQLQFSHDGNSIAAIDSDQTITIWDSSLQNQFMQWQYPKASCFQLKPDGGFMVVGGWGSTLDILDMNDRTKDRKVNVTKITTRSVAWSPDGKLIASGQWPDRIEVNNALERG